MERLKALIAAIPSADELYKLTKSDEEPSDPDALRAHLEDIAQKAKEILEEYQGLSDEDREKLGDLGWLNEIIELLTDSDKKSEEAAYYLNDLAFEDISIIRGSDDESESGTVSDGDTVDFGFKAGVGIDGEGTPEDARVRFEFILPLAADKAEFALDRMGWADESEGYEPSVASGTIEIDGIETECQILTAYSELLTEKEAVAELTGSVSVRIIGMEDGEYAALLMSAVIGDGELLTAETDRIAYTAPIDEAALEKAYNEFAAEVEALEQSAEDTDADELTASAEELLELLRAAHDKKQLSDEAYSELCGRLEALIAVDPNTIAEAATGTNWMLLRDSGWFEAYSDYATGEASASRAMFARSPELSLLADSGDETAVQPSNVQVTERGGMNTSEDGSVSVSKTISGTDLENVFDITLQVQTSMKVEDISTEPDMAVVIVMDISNTMNSNFGEEGTTITRYSAAMEAAENFLDQFAANNSLGISKVGYVAFNTDAHQIFGLKSCSTQEQANVLKNTMRTQTEPIINAPGYKDAHNRFTNVEAGLAMASDMLNGVTNKNKFIIFLSDGFPTTYISSGYSGYDPYDSTGRFYDHVLNKKCLYGTSYSDEAAIRARKKAATIKASGTTIFSIGVDVAGQTIQEYITQSENADGFSVVDRTGTTYEIGAPGSTESYKTWLREKIGSGYYYDSTNTEGLKAAYDQIFTEIKHKVEAGSVADWVASDPLPTIGGSTEFVEFIGFYNKAPELVFTNLIGEHELNSENTASINADKTSISWDLKNSGYTTTTFDG
ncbi:MAG: VWA domain-containing protein, partial [Candidatus Flemingiibacterium sp.]